MHNTRIYTSFRQCNIDTCPLFNYSFPIEIEYLIKIDNERYVRFQVVNTVCYV